MLVGAVTGTLKGDASSWVAESHRARASLGAVRIEAQQLSGALAQTTAATKANEAAAANLSKTAQQAKGQMAGLAGSMGQMSGAMGAAGGEAQKLVAGLAGVAGMLGPGTMAVGGALAVATVAMGVLNHKMKQQEEAAESLEKKWQDATRAYIKLRDVSSQKRFDEEDRAKVLALQEGGMDEKTASATVSHEKDLAAATAMRKAATDGLVAKRQELLTTYAAEQTRLDKLVQSDTQVIIGRQQAKKALEEGLAAAEMEAKANEAHATTAINNLNRQMSLLDSNNEKEKELAEKKERQEEAARKRLTLEQQTAKALEEQARAFASMGAPEREARALSAVPMFGAGAAAMALADGRGVEEALVRAADNYDAHLKDLAAEQEAAMYGATDAAIAFSTAMREAAESFARDVIDLRMQLGNEFNAIVHEFAERASMFLPDAGMAGGAVAGVISGQGAASIGGAVGSAGGAIAGMALGDPTGMIGGAAGGALGTMLGGVIDKLPGMVALGESVMSIIGRLAAPLDQLYTPFVRMADLLGKIADRTLVPFLEKAAALVGDGLDIFWSLFMVMAPFVDIILELSIPMIAFAAVATVLVPLMDDLARGVRRATEVAFEWANALIAFLNDVLGTNLREFDTSFEFTPQPDAADKSALKDAIKEGTKAGTVEGMEAFNRNVRNLPGYKGLAGAEFDAASPGQPTVTIGSVTFVVQQPMSVNDAAKHAADFRRHGGIVTVPTRGGNPTRRN